MGDQRGHVHERHLELSRRQDEDLSPALLEQQDLIGRVEADERRYALGPAHAHEEEAGGRLAHRLGAAQEVGEGSGGGGGGGGRCCCWLGRDGRSRGRVVVVQVVVAGEFERACAVGRV